MTAFTQGVGVLPKVPVAADDLCTSDQQVCQTFEMEWVGWEKTDATHSDTPGAKMLRKACVSACWDTQCALDPEPTQAICALCGIPAHGPYRW